jgi:hypothetical protein
MTAVDHAAEAEREIEDLFAPLKARDLEIEREVANLEEQIRKLRAVRVRIRSVIRTTEPDYGKRPFARNGKPNRPGELPKGISEERIQAFAGWLTDNADDLNAMHDGEGFYASGLERDWRDRLPDDMKRQTDISKAVKVLHERGVIRLTSVGHAGRRNFKVVI